MTLFIDLGASISSVTKAAHAGQFVTARRCYLELLEIVKVW
jgi:hypothetical protein